DAQRDHLQDASLPVHDLPRKAGLGAGRYPGASEVVYGPALAVEHPGDHAASLPLERLRSLPLRFEDGAEIGVEREHAALAVLRLARLETEPASGEVHGGPATREQLGGHAPACDVGDLGDGPQLLRQMLHDRTMLRQLEEPRPDVALLEHV